MKLSDYAREIGVTYKTAYRMFKRGELDAYQLPTGTIIVNESVNPVAGSTSLSRSGVALYARVSSHDQKADAERQLQRLRDYAAARGYQVNKEVTEIASGLNDSRPKFSNLLTDNSLGVILVEHRDRATRFGFNTIALLLESQGRRLEVINETDTKDELVDDFVASSPQWRPGYTAVEPPSSGLSRYGGVWKMPIHKAYKTELKLNNKQRTLLARCAGTARYAYNWGLRSKIDEYEATGKSPNYYELHRRLNGLKKTELSWMYEVSKTIPQEALRDLDRAFQNFFRRLKNQDGKGGEKPGFPRFKSRHRGLGSFRIWGAIRVTAGQIKLPRLGWLRLKEKGYLPAEGVKILSATISERAGRWFVSLQVEEALPETTATGEPLGVDLGVTTMAVCSNGDRYENPKALTKALKRLARTQRELARRQKGSRNRARTKARLAKLHLRIANIRQNALHQATSAIVARTKPHTERPRVIVMEALNVAGMMKNHSLARAIGEVGMGEFGRQLEYKTAWSGSRFVKADRWFPSSKQCSRCHQVKGTLSLSERVYRCNDCGLVIDRDLNAAINLMQLSTASSAGIEACGEVAVAAL